MSYANPHYDPDWKALHERHAGERQRAQEELNRLAESGAMMSDAYKTAQAAFRRHNAACLATNNMQHATVQEFAEWLFGSFRVDINDREGGIPVPQVDFAALRTIEEVYAAWTRIHTVVSDAAWERRHRLPVGQPAGLAAFSDAAAPGLTRFWRQFSGRELYPGGYAPGNGVRTLITVDAREDGWHVCFMHDAGSPGASVTNAIELLATAVYREACAIAGAGTSQARGLRAWFGRGRLPRQRTALLDPWRFRFYQHIPPGPSSREEFDRVALRFADGAFNDPQWIGYPVIPKLIQSARFDCALDAALQGQERVAISHAAQGS
jgi:hypothetical protein